MKHFFFAISAITATVLAAPITAQTITSFDSGLFLDKGPHQQGTVKIDRSKLQTVVTWCSPTLLQMKVYEGVAESYPTDYQKLHGNNHPLQVSVTVFTPTLPFDFASNYHEPAYVTSICDPASVHTSLSSPGTRAAPLQYNLDEAFQTTPAALSVVYVNCSMKKAGLSETGYFTGPAYGSVGGVALIPAGDSPSVTANCKPGGFSIKMK